MSALSCKTLYRSGPGGTGQFVHITEHQGVCKLICTGLRIWARCLDYVHMFIWIKFCNSESREYCISRAAKVLYNHYNTLQSSTYVSEFVFVNIVNTRPTPLMDLWNEDEREAYVNQDLYLLPSGGSDTTTPAAIQSTTPITKKISQRIAPVTTRHFFCISA